METKTHMRGSHKLQIQEELRHQHRLPCNTIHHNEGKKKNFPQKKYTVAVCVH